MLALAEQGLVEIILFDFVLSEFEGTSKKYIPKLRSNLVSLCSKDGASKELKRISVNLREGAEYPSFAAIGDQIQELTKLAENNLSILEYNRSTLIDKLKTNQVRGIRRIQESLEINHAGMVRYRRGDPPDSPDKGMKDCIIFEYLIAFGKTNLEWANPAQKLYFLTKDGDFDHDCLDKELAAFGIFRRNDFDRLHYEIKGLP